MDIIEENECDGTDEAPYTLEDIQGWIKSVRTQINTDPQVAALPNDLFFIAAIAQALPEVVWHEVSGSLILINSALNGGHGPIPVSNYKATIGLVSFDGVLLCPRQEPDTLVERMLQARIFDTVNALSSKFNPNRHQVVNIEIKQVEEEEIFEDLFDFTGLTPRRVPATQVLVEHHARETAIASLAAYRARHLAAYALERDTPPAQAVSVQRRI